MRALYLRPKPTLLFAVLGDEPCFGSPPTIYLQGSKCSDCGGHNVVPEPKCTACSGPLAGKPALALIYEGEVIPSAWYRAARVVNDRRHPEARSSEISLNPTADEAQALAEEGERLGIWTIREGLQHEQHRDSTVAQPAPAASTE